MEIETLNVWFKNFDILDPIFAVYMTLRLLTVHIVWFLDLSEFCSLSLSIDHVVYEGCAKLKV